MMKMNCPNCQKQEWREGSVLILSKEIEEDTKPVVFGRMKLKPWVCQSCDMVIFTLVGEDEKTVLLTEDFTEDAE